MLLREALQSTLKYLKSCMQHAARRLPALAMSPPKKTKKNGLFSGGLLKLLDYWILISC